MAVLKCALFLSMFQVVRGAVYQHKVTPKLTPLANYLGATAVAGGRGNSTITVQPQSKALEWYVVDIAVGTPPQHFHVWFSTGWSEFWVTDSGCMLYHLGQAPFAPCPVEPQPGYKRAFFNESASSTLKKANRGRAELYFANGWLATDVFQLGGLQIKNMSVVLADRLDDDFETEFRALKNWPIDGILGLGTGTPWDNTGAWASPLQQIVPLLDRPMFTFALSGHQDQKAGTGAGVLTYGAVDTVNCASDWHYVNAYNDVSDGGDEFSTWRTWIDG
ncbi:ASP-1 protein [Aphelenchoides avenae]|nr:ASP-1 protein [Aphelenchus avenae]